MSEITKEDASKLVEYIVWLEERIEGYDISGEFEKCEDSFRKLVSVSKI